MSKVENFAVLFRSAVSTLLAAMAQATNEKVDMDTELFKKQGGATVTMRDLADAFIETEKDGLIVEDDKTLTFSASVSRRCYDCPVSAAKDTLGPGFWFKQFLTIANELGVENAKASRGAKQLTANKVAKALSADQLLAMRKAALAKATAINAKTETTATE